MQAGGQGALPTYGQEVRHSTTAQASLLPAAAHLSLEPHAWAAADVDGADALGAIQLVARDGQQVNVHRVHINGDLAHCLQRAEGWSGPRRVGVGSAAAEGNQVKKMGKQWGESRCAGQA